MRVIDIDDIFLSESDYGEDSVVLQFTYDGVYTGEYPISDRYQHRVGFKEKTDNKEILPSGMPEEIWIDNYPALETYLDEEDALPNGIIFKLADDDEVLEESIDLREFLRKYIFTNNILL